MNTTQTDKLQTTIPQRYPTVKLLFSGGIVSRTVSLRPDATLIGREVDDELGIALTADHQASRRHARIELKKSDGTTAVACITDLGSKNGVFVNGNPVAHSELHDGDIIRLGNSLLVVRMESVDQGIMQEGVLLGESPNIRELRSQLAKAARQSGPILLMGETGTGKDLSAQLLHSLSPRADGSMVHVNTSAIPESLAEGQLFGYKKGSFTGAKEDFIGLFRQADKGTLFLNEIGDMSLFIQAKLLSALERKEVLPVGAVRPVSCDARFIAATNRNLRVMVRQGLFREDLYERIRGTEIKLPALRTRQEDILPILSHATNKDGGRRPIRMTARLGELLLLYHWPGNVRELLNLAQSISQDVEQGVEIDLGQVRDRLNLTDEEALEQGDEQETVSADVIAEPTVSVVSAAAQKSSERHLQQPRLSQEALRRLWEETGHNVSKFATQIARSRRQARRWLDELGLRKR